VARDLVAHPHDAGRELDGLRSRRLNFSPPRRRPSPEEGWRIEDYRQALPREEPGEPAAGGSWEVARRILRDYDFVDPSLVRALYRSGDRLEGRDMLLELRIWGLRFHVGVRVGEVLDATLTEEGRQARVWGWDYHTLEGHFEAGQMDYQVRKWLDTGEVEFRISAFSRVAPIPNPVLRLGFHLLGQRKQTQFGRRACERMRSLTIEELRSEEPRARTHEVVEGLVVRPAAS
jgi:uncharacterized protein (UPF0548 family)